MEDIINNLDELLAKAGQANRYQFIIVILFLIQFICSDFLNTGLPYLQNQPYIILNNTNESIKLNYTLCEKNFEIDRTKIFLHLLLIMKFIVIKIKFLQLKFLYF